MRYFHDTPDGLVERLTLAFPEPGLAEHFSACESHYRAARIDHLRERAAATEMYTFIGDMRGAIITKAQGFSFDGQGWTRALEHLRLDQFETLGPRLREEFTCGFSLCMDLLRIMIVTTPHPDTPAVDLVWPSFVDHIAAVSEYVIGFDQRAV